MSEEEYNQICGFNLKLQNNKIRSLPYVFTEQGIAMLSGLLKNDIAIQVSINIMNAFVEMRKFLMRNGQVFERLTNVEYKLLEHDKKFDKVFLFINIKCKRCLFVLHILKKVLKYVR